MSFHNQLNQKVYFSFYPPERHNNTLAGATKGSKIIGKKRLKNIQLPNEKLKSKINFKKTNRLVKKAILRLRFLNSSPHIPKPHTKP